MELLSLSIDDVRVWKTPSSLSDAMFHPDERPENFYNWMIEAWVNTQNTLHGLGYFQVDVSKSNIMFRIKRFERIDGRPCVTLDGLNLCLTGFSHANSHDGSPSQEFYQWGSWFGKQKVPCKVKERFGIAQTVLDGLLADSGAFLRQFPETNKQTLGKLFRNDPTARSGNWLLYWFTHKQATCDTTIHSRLCYRLQNNAFRSYWTDEKVLSLDKGLSLGPIGAWVQIKWDKI
jgi:hypothetical protein